MNRGLFYSLMAGGLGVLLVVAPLLFVPAVENMGRYETLPSPESLSERMKAFESLYDFHEAAVQSHFIAVLIFVFGFVAASVAYILVKFKFLH